MSRYCYQNTVTDFLTEDKSAWIEEMKAAFAELSPLPLSPSQVNAWKDCFDVLQGELPDFDKAHPGFSVIFEYMLPYESGRRPDVILLSAEQVLILEFKQKIVAEQADVDQCKAYGRDIRNYHFESRDKEVLDALVLTRASGKLARNRYTKTPVISGDELGEYLEKVVDPTTTPTDVDAWCEG